MSWGRQLGFGAVAIVAVGLLEQGPAVAQSTDTNDDDTIRFRVEVARLPIWYVKLATNRVTGDAKAELLRRFLSVARKAGISNISESRSLDDWAKRMGAE